ncbi:DUF3106 domain-containing protein [Luteimonas huabeiensis]|uniref:DUF3106 domain-containing protein n=1 Tax=Luteimonas huabeiensis TaxID=1244513 RepID=UPI0004B48DC7|nr:DUF3106 domain-containing protein [Luteimonas huabeiensis]
MPKVALAALLCLLALPAWAQALPQALRTLPAAERTRIEAQARQWAALPPAQREALRQRMAQWDALPLPERQARRAAWAVWETLPEAERARLRATAAAYARMPEAQRRELAERYAALDALEREGWGLGTVLGAEWPQLHGLFALVPGDQRAELLAMLRALDERARADLAIVAQRTPPEERDALRRKLLSMPAPVRADWLRGQASPD